MLDGRDGWEVVLRIADKCGTMSYSEGRPTLHYSSNVRRTTSALLAKLKEDAGLQGKLKGAADLDAAVALLEEAGFDVSKADLLRYQAKQTLELSDEELEGVTGGSIGVLVATVVAPGMAYGLLKIMD